MKETSEEFVHLLRVMETLVREIMIECPKGEGMVPYLVVGLLLDRRIEIKLRNGKEEGS